MSENSEDGFEPIAPDDPAEQARPKGWRRRSLLFSALGALFGTPPLAVLFGGGYFSAPRYRGPRSDHFDGERFHNQRSIGGRGLAEFVRWRWTRKPGVWAAREDMRPARAPPERVGRAAIRVTFVNHATTLIQTGGLNILTDPIWSERCSPLSWAGPTRAHAPGIRFEDLPPIDHVLVSHNHYDHLDLPTLERLRRIHNPRFFTPLGNSALLESSGIGPSTDMDWWDEARLGDEPRLTCVPAQHWSGRGTRDRAATLWCGYVVSAPSGAIYFAGDTGAGPQFKQVREKFGPPRVALLPIGAYRPRWFMQPVHLSPREAVQAHLALGAELTVGIHFGTFQLADDGRDEPLEDLARALDEFDVAGARFAAPSPGQAFQLRRA